MASNVLAHVTSQWSHDIHSVAPSDLTPDIESDWEEHKCAYTAADAGAV